MDAAETWNLVADTFTQAIDLDPRARVALLESTFPAGSPLRQQVERLLAAHDSAGDFLDVLDRDRSAALIAVTSPGEETPDTIGRYPVIREIGRGGMGVVYLAHDPPLDRAVAIKLLRRTAGAGTRGRSRLLEEARAASALDHPNVATVHEVGETEDGRAFIAMTYCEGEPLAARLEQGNLSTHEAAHVGTQIADALAAAHAVGVVHRDVKPANVVVSAEGRARLMDFGVAIVGESAGHAAPAGTLAYMSPEQRRGEAVLPSSDVWSLGLLLFEMLSGQRTAPGTGPPRDRTLDKLRAPRRLRRLVRGCMSPVAARRPTAAAAAAELRAFLREEEASWPLPDALVMAGLCIALLAAGWVLLRPSNPPSGTTTTLVVLPLAAPAQDMSLQRLGRDIVVTLSSALDGMAGIRVADPIAVRAGAGPQQAGNDAAALRRARRLGAGTVVLGQLSRTDHGVRALATVHDVNTGRVLGDMSTESDGDIAALTDSIVLALFRSRWAETIAHASPAAARTTASVPALRAFLDGERAIANGRFRLAPESFARSLDADPGFWFAAWRYWFSRSYHGSPVDSAIIAAVAANRALFPEPDRMLIDARLAAGARNRLNRLRAVTERHPTHWLAWFELGDHLTHHGAFLGIQLDEARTALRRAAELNPRLVPAWEHLFWTAILARDTVESGRVLVQLETLRMDTLARLEWDLQPLDYYGYLDRLARAGGMPRAADANIGARILSGTPGAADPERTSATLLVYGFHRAQLDLSQRVIEVGAAPRVAAAHTWGSALAWAGRGDWAAAFAAARKYARAPSYERGAVWAYGLAVTGAWLGRIPPDTAAVLRAEAQRSAYARSAAGEAELAWLDGVLACARGDDAALARQQATLARNGAASAAALARSLAAFQAARSGRRSEAAHALAAVESQNADAGWQFTYGALHPFASAVNRIAAAHWFIETGDTAAAAPLLLLHETDLPSTLHPLAPVHAILGTFSLAALADIEDARGRSGVAQHYRAMLRERADLALMPDSALALCRQPIPAKNVITSMFTFPANPAQE